MKASEALREVIEAPIALTNTLNVGLVLDALVQHAIEEYRVRFNQRSCLHSSS